MKGNITDAGKPAKRTKRQELSPEALRILFRRNPSDLVKTLNKMLGRALTPATIQSVICEIDSSGLSRLVIAVFGVTKAAEQLGVDEKLVHRLRQARPKMESNGFFRTESDLDLSGLSNIEVPGLVEVGTSLKATSSSLINLPDLKRVGWDLLAERSESLSAPGLEEVGRCLRAKDAKHLDFPSLRLAGGLVDPNGNMNIFESALHSKARAHAEKNVEEVFPSLNCLGSEGLSLIGSNHLSLPALETIEGPVLVKSCRSLSFPTLRHVGGHLTVEVCQDLLMPALTIVGGDADLRLSPSTSLPSLKTVEGHALGCKENFPGLIEFT
jgi:hypothetical protein